jgi:hypothetical protein
VEARRSDLLVPQRVREAVPFIETNTVDAEFLVGTMTSLLHYDRGRLHRLFEGHCFEMTRYRDRWYVFRQLARRYSGEIVSFRLQAGTVCDLRLEATLLGPWVHQIHAYGDSLYVADTTNNRLIGYAIEADGLIRKRCAYAGEWFGTDVHLNSVCAHREQLSVMYHNLTQKTGRRSQIAVFGLDLRFKRLIDTPAGSAHNISFADGKLLYCDSDAGSVVWENRVFRTGIFTRGLAVSDSLFLVGGSEIEKRELRHSSTGHVLAFDREQRDPTAMIKIPKSGNVLELALQPASPAS